MAPRRLNIKTSGVTNNSISSWKIQNKFVHKAASNDDGDDSSSSYNYVDQNNCDKSDNSSSSYNFLNNYNDDTTSSYEYLKQSEKTADFDLDSNLSILVKHAKESRYKLKGEAKSAYLNIDTYLDVNSSNQPIYSNVLNRVQKAFEKIRKEGNYSYDSVASRFIDISNYSKIEGYERCSLHGVSALSSKGKLPLCPYNIYLWKDGEMVKVQDRNAEKTVVYVHENDNLPKVELDKIKSTGNSVAINLFNDTPKYVKTTEQDATTKTSTTKTSTSTKTTTNNSDNGGNGNKFIFIILLVLAVLLLGVFLASKNVSKK